MPIGFGSWRVRVRPAVLAYVTAVPMAAVIGWDLLGMPLQVADCLSLVVDAAQSQSVAHTLSSAAHFSGYFRPLFYAQVKLLFDLAQGEYVLTYRLFQIGLITGLLLLFVRALDVRTRAALVAAPLALTVLVGLHTFLTTVKEIYPVNHYLEIAVFALLALNLAQSRGGWIVDVASVITFVVAALTLESGLLVWVVFVAGWCSGMPGVSRRGVVAVTGLLGVYLWLRFAYFDIGTPGLYERSAGFLLARLDPPELEARFGASLLQFRAYNVTVSALSVLFSEPRSGLWVLVRDWLAGDVAPRTWLNVGTSCFATGLIAWYVADRVRAGVRWPITLRDRQVFVFAAMLAANCLLSFSYSKDEIVSTAGVFYAIAAAGAAAHVAEHAERWRLTTGAVCVAIICVVGSLGWAIRAAGVHDVLRRQAFAQRNDWVWMEAEWRRQGMWEKYAPFIPLIEDLRREALETRVPNPRSTPRWANRLFDADY